MIQTFVKAWDANKEKLEKYFRETPQSEYSTYRGLVRALFAEVINPYLESEARDYIDLFNLQRILMIDDGEYQGTQIFFLHLNCYQPCIHDYVMTYVEYGSCSGCDTLLSISNYDDGIPRESQVARYMTLCLHLLQRCKFLEEVE